MKLTIDTDLGAAFTSVYNYVEGGDNEISVYLPQFTDHSPLFIAEMFEETAGYLEMHLHDLYAAVDALKGKQVRKYLRYARLQLGTQLSDTDMYLAHDLEILEYRHELLGQVGIIDDLLDLGKHQCKASLKLQKVEIIADRSAFYAHFGVPGLTVAPVVVLVDHTV